VRRALLFWIFTPCTLVGRCQCFGEKQSPSSGLKMLKIETVFFPETLAPADYAAPKHKRTTPPRINMSFEIAQTQNTTLSYK
jgi:hypothetical protein